MLFARKACSRIVRDIRYRLDCELGSAVSGFGICRGHRPATSSEKIEGAGTSTVARSPGLSMSSHPAGCAETMDVTAASPRPRAGALSISSDLLSRASSAETLRLRVLRSMEKTAGKLRSSKPSAERFLASKAHPRASEDQPIERSLRRDHSRSRVPSSPGLRRFQWVSSVRRIPSQLGPGTVLRAIRVSSRRRASSAKAPSKALQPLSPHYGPLPEPCRRAGHRNMPPKQFVAFHGPFFCFAS